MIEPQKLKIEPYARLLTMLGEQLIKNERIALVELIKNSYDADASWVKVSFIRFGPNFEVTSDSKIVIEDDGVGMSLNVIRNHWLSPATPIKKLKKLISDVTDKGRKLQGEKGIGRFAVLKLGRKIDITTRPVTGKTEYVVGLDFAKYDDDFLEESGKKKELFLSDLEVDLNERRPISMLRQEIELGAVKIDREPHGTRIEISHLKGMWSRSKVEMMFKDLVRFESIFSNGMVQTKSMKKVSVGDPNDFNVFVYKDDQEVPYSDTYLETLHGLIEQRAVIKVEKARYDEPNRRFEFEIDGRRQSLSLLDPEILGNLIFKKSFGEHGYDFTKRTTTCGSFEFGFYVFDFSSEAPPTFALDRADKAIIKEHRIYLYRDGIRVYPYGDPEDDWLRIDAYRGTISAGQFLSNDQVVGYVNISQKNNPNLRDKTNREGLIETGDSTENFIWLLQTFLSWLRAKPYNKYRLGLKEKSVISGFKEELVKSGFDEIREAVKDNKQAQLLLTRAEKRYQAERSYLVQRAEATEDLAGVGLSVESASHDIMSVMQKAQISLDNLIRTTQHKNTIDPEKLHQELTSIRGMMSFIEAQLKDVQLLFRSSKQRRKDIRIYETLAKVVRLYESTLSKKGIEYEVVTVGPPVVAKTTDAVLLQVLLNLFDNAVYWLETVSSNRRIVVTLNGNDGTLIFSDSGPGINPDDAPYLFEPFFSGKGQDGRGLGLYIARQLLERQEYGIELAELKSERILKGANFVITFVKDAK